MISFKNYTWYVSNIYIDMLEIKSANNAFLLTIFSPHKCCDQLIQLVVEGCIPHLTSRTASGYAKLVHHFNRCICTWSMVFCKS